MNDYEVHTVPLNIALWERGIKGMDAAEVGAYWALTLHLYGSPGGTYEPPTERHLMTVCNIRDKRLWKRVRPIIMAKFEVTDGVISKAKISAVIQSMKTKSALAKRAADTRHGKKDNKNNDDDVRPQSGGNAIKNIGSNISKDIEDFEKFYAAYPATAHSSKPATQRAWDELSDSDKAHCVAVAPLYADAVKSTDPKFIKSPQGFITNKMFFNYTAPKAAELLVMPDEGTDERALYDAAKAHGIALSTCAAWLRPDKITISGGIIYARNAFTRTSVEAKFGAAIQSSGLVLAAPGEKIKESEVV